MYQGLTYDIDNDPTSEEGILRKVCEMKIIDPCACLQSFTHDQSVGQRILQNRWRKITFADFTQDLVQLYILEERTRQMQHSQSRLLNVTEEDKLAFAIEIVQNANC